MRQPRSCGLMPPAIGGWIFFDNECSRNSGGMSDEDGISVKNKRARDSLDQSFRIESASVFEIDRNLTSLIEDTTVMIQHSTG